MPKKIFFLCLAVILFTSVKLHAQNPGEEIRIKEVIKKAFLVEQQGFAITVEHAGQEYPGRPSDDVFLELGEYVSDKKGYLAKLKSFLPIKSNNESQFNMKVKKRVFKDFDFKSITIDGDTATVEVDKYDEVTSTVGAGRTVEFITDEYDNIIDKKVYESEARDFTIKGGSKHFITLEKENNETVQLLFHTNPPEV